MDTENFVGGAWLVAHYGIELALPLFVQSCIGGRRASAVVDGVSVETFVASMRPKANLRGHLVFHLKHEVLHLELLARVFSKVDPAELVKWIDEEPGGQYARRAGFLFEWLTGSELKVRAEIAGAYVDAVDEQKWVVASPGCTRSNPRWRVTDNLPGSPAFCPMVRKTEALALAAAVDVRRLLNDLELEFGAEVLMRSAVWMTLRESKSSFAIEGESDQSERIQRFSDVLARRTGHGSPPLDDAMLAQLQADILGKRSTLQRFGIRQSPVFVGELVRYQEVVHYVAPPPEDLPAMLEGLATFMERTHGQSAAMRSAVMAFGFVYIHPLADGNGRVHRFLINDILRRDGVVSAPMVLPVSSLIDSKPAERQAYKQILDTVSRPLMRLLDGQCAFAPLQVAFPDGIHSNFVFRGNDTARPAWRYPDLTRHVVYLADVLERTVRHDMRNESRYLRAHARAREAIKALVEMPDLQADRVIRSVQTNQGQLSNVLKKEISLLAEPALWAAIVQAIEGAFDV